MLVVGTMLWARRNRIGERHKEIVVSTSSDKTTMESIVAAQHGLKNLHEIVKTTNIAILRIWSILIGKSPKVRFPKYDSIIICFPRITAIDVSNSKQMW